MNSTAATNTALTADLAANLLTHAPVSSITDLLVERSGVLEGDAASNADVTLVLGAEPGPAAARALLANRKTAAATASAACLRDPDLLTAMARSRSVLQQRAAAMNPGTPRAELDRLASAALRRRDEKLAAALAATLDPPTWLEQTDQLPTLWLEAGAATDNVITQLERRADPDLVRATASAAARHWPRTRPVAAAVIVGIVRGVIPGRLEEVLDLVSSTAAPGPDAVVQLAGLTLARFPDGVPFGEGYATGVTAWLNHASYVHLHHEASRAVAMARPMSSATIKMFTQAAHGLGARGVARSFAAGLVDLDAGQLDQLIERHPAEAAAILLPDAASRARLSSQQLDTLTAALRGSEVHVATLLHAPDARTFSPEAQANLLRRGNPALTSRWVRGHLPCAPTLAAALDLAQNPGTALGRNPHSSDTSVAAIVATVAADLRVEDLTNPGVLDLLEHCPQLVLRRASDRDADPTTNPFLHLLGTRAASTLADNATAWALLLILAEDPPATLTDLLEAAAGGGATAT